MGQFSDSKISQLTVHGNTTVQGTLYTNQIFGINDYIFHGSNCANDWNCQWLSTKPTFSSATDDSWYIADTDSAWNCGLISKHKFLRTPGLTLEWEHSSATTRLIMIGFIDDRNNYSDYTYAQSTTNLIYDNNGNNLEIYENAGLPYYYSRGSATGYHKYKIVLKNLGCDYYYDDVLIYTSVVNSTKYLRVHMSLNYGTIYFRNMRVYVNYDFITNGDRGVFMGGEYNYYESSDMDYITISTPSNATTFGALISSRWYSGVGSNGLIGRGVSFGGAYFNDRNDLVNNTTNEYISINTISNSISFGNCSSYGTRGICTNLTYNRGVAGGGYIASSYTFINAMEYITISTLSDAVAFGTLYKQRYRTTGTSNGTNDRGIYVGGHENIGAHDTYEYITISTTGNGTSFGTISAQKYGIGATSNTISNRAIFVAGGLGNVTYQNIEYMNITVGGVCSAFGNISYNGRYASCTSNGTNNRGVYGGLYDNNSYYYKNIVEYVNISTTGNAVDFGDLTSTRVMTGSCSNAN